jgi:predicted Zn-dependent protease
VPYRHRRRRRGLVAEPSRWSRLRAALAGRHEQAIALADAVLAQDPADRGGLDALAVSADATGDTAAALRAAELTWLAGRRAPTIAVAGNYAWALVRARESEVAPPDWSARTRAALAEVDRLGGDGWELDGTRALFAVLTGRPADAIELLQRPLRVTVDPQDRASELLTLSMARADSGDADGQRAALQEAQALAPDHPRLPLVLLRFTADSHTG